MVKQQPPTHFSQRILIPWAVCLLPALFYSYDFFLRVQPSVMINPLMQAYHGSAAQIGFLSAFYYYAYTPLQIPAGILIDHYRPRIILTISALLYAVGAFLFAADFNLTIAFIARALMGMGSAFAFIGALRLAAVWLPENQFGFYTGFTTGLGTLGAMSADIALSRMVHSIGWQQAVNVTGYIGVVLTILIFVIVRNRPKWRKPAPPGARDWSLAWGRLVFIFKNWQFWINGLVGCFFFLPINVFASLWGVAFIEKAYHVSVQHAATAISLIFLGTAIGGPLAGWISDKIHRRRRPILIWTVATFILTCLILYEHDLAHWILYTMLFGLGFFVGAQVLVFAISHEISPIRATATATAGTNFLVTIGAAIFQPLIGYLLDLTWKGAVQNGVHVYSLHGYKLALSILPAVLIISFLITFLIPETRGKFLNKYLYPKSGAMS